MDAQEKQQGLNEVVIRKVEKMVTARQENVRDVIGRLHREQELLRDYIVPIGTEHNHFNQTSAVSFRDEGTVTLTIPQGAYSLHGHAIGQLAARMNIPSRYLRELATGEPWQRSLATDMLNQHAIHTPRSRVLAPDRRNRSTGRVERQLPTYRQPVVSDHLFTRSETAGCGNLRRLHERHESMGRDDPADTTDHPDS